MSTPLILVQLKRLFRQVRSLPVGEYPIPVQYRLRGLLTATIEALHELYASSLRYLDFFRNQLVLNQIRLVRQAIHLAPSVTFSLMVSGPSLATWQHTHELLLHVLETTLATPPLE